MTAQQLLDKLQERAKSHPKSMDNEVVLLVGPDDEDDPWYYATLTSVRPVHDRLAWEDEPGFYLYLEGQDGR